MMHCEKLSIRIKCRWTSQSQPSPVYTKPIPMGASRNARGFPGEKERPRKCMNFQYLKPYINSEEGLKEKMYCQL